MRDTTDSLPSQILVVNSLQYSGKPAANEWHWHWAVNPAILGKATRHPLSPSALLHLAQLDQSLHAWRTSDGWTALNVRDEPLERMRLRQRESSILHCVALSECHTG
jgi:hypothetical protein